MPSRLCNKDSINRSLVYISTESVGHRNSVRKWFSFSCFPKKNIGRQPRLVAAYRRVAVRRFHPHLRIRPIAPQLCKKDRGEGSFARSYPLSRGAVSLAN
jgi:hypothetical protein